MTTNLAQKVRLQYRPFALPTFNLQRRLPQHIAHGRHPLSPQNCTNQRILLQHLLERGIRFVVFHEDLLSKMFL